MEKTRRQLEKLIKIHPGNNVGKGNDDTLFALIDGKVKFHRLGKARKQVSIVAQS